MLLNRLLQTGTIMNSDREFSLDKEWNWVRPTALSKRYMVMESQGKDTFECVVQDGYPPKVYFFSRILAEIYTS